MEMKITQLAVYIEQDEDGMYIGSVPSIPSCYAEGHTQEEMMENLTDVVKSKVRIYFFVIPMAVPQSFLSIIRS